MRSNRDERRVAEVDIEGDPGVETRARSKYRSLGPLVVVVLVAAAVAIAFGLWSGGEKSVANTTTTPAQPFAEPEPVTVHAATATTGDAGDEWNVVDIGFETRLGNVISSGSGFLAVGRDIDGTGLWQSTDGVTWEMIHRLEVPPGVEESVMSTNWDQFDWRLFDQGGTAVVFGWLGNATGVWVDGTLSGFVDDEEAMLMPQVLVGERLLVESSFGWVVSDDGNEWAPVDGLPAEDLYPVGYVDDYYYLGGRCGPTACEPGQMYRSGDGAIWEAVDVGVPVGANDARVFRIAIVSEGLTAIGSVWVSDYAPAIWQSIDGADWVLTELDDAYQTRTATIELVATNQLTQGTAVLAVDGVEYTLPEGSEIETGVGSISVSRINSDNVILATGEAMSLLEMRASMTVTQYSRLDTIVSRGDLAVVGGARFVHALDFPEIGIGRFAAWFTLDGGGTWEASTFDEFANVHSVALSEDGVLMVGQTETTSTIVAYREFASE